MKRRQFLKALGLLLAGGTATGAGAFTLARSRNPYYDGPISDHFDGLNFYNPNGVAPKGFVELLKWQMGGGRKPWPERYPSPYEDVPPQKVTADDLRVSFVGHATVLIQTEGLNILTDPVWSERASPVTFAGPKRVNDPGISFDNLPPIDVVLLSHNHYDHLDLPTLSKLKAVHDPLIVTPLGNDRIMKNHDQSLRIAVGDWGDTIELTKQVKVTLEPMHHWSARGMGDRRNALWAAFVLQTPGGNIYHIGDTGFHGGQNYLDARNKYRNFRLAILPFGAYEPRDFMRGQHQNPDEAVQGHLMCGAEFTLGHHWGTFRLTNESIEDQLEALDAARSKHGVDEDIFRALRPGQVWEVPRQRPQKA
ncbi:MAG: MBL fold metallo-hydrolase [Rhizobiaceae bacterium]|nr:MBL fold metallo-hydrolase [Hyphomicrobiales bacterium]NRB29556.1 MBL fold metallo-hydrolase [Rhizobiaceae bacterium]